MSVRNLMRFEVPKGNLPKSTEQQRCLSTDPPLQFTITRRRHFGPRSCIIPGLELPQNQNAFFENVFNANTFKNDSEKASY